MDIAHPLSAIPTSTSSSTSNLGNVTNSVSVSAGGISVFLSGKDNVTDFRDTVTTAIPFSLSPRPYSSLPTSSSTSSLPSSLLATSSSSIENNGKTKFIYFILLYFSSFHFTLFLSI